MPPLPTTGMESAAATSPMADQSQAPQRFLFCFTVRPCSVTALAPQASSIFANATVPSTPPWLSSSTRIFTVTGTASPCTMPSTRRFTVSGSRSKYAP